MLNGYNICGWGHSPTWMNLILEHILHEEHKAFGKADPAVTLSP